MPQECNSKSIPTSLPSHNERLGPAFAATSGRDSSAKSRVHRSPVLDHPEGRNSEVRKSPHGQDLSGVVGDLTTVDQVQGHAPKI